MVETLALIPARGDSKSIPRKNIRLMAGYPLIAYSIVAGLEAETVDRVIVSTDDEEIAAIARVWGAEVPFIRPAEFATDDATDLQVFQHALTWLADHEAYRPDICLHLRPTYPIRDLDDVGAVLTLLINNPVVDSVRSVAVCDDPPFKMWFMSDTGQLNPVVDTSIKDAYNQPRQALPVAYLQNACLDAVRSNVILDQNSMSGQYIVGYRMSHNYDIDTQEQFDIVQNALRQRADTALIQAMRRRFPPPPATPKTFCFDIDGVIATLVPSPNDYDQAEPIDMMIAAINFLYDTGNYIVLFTARGSETGQDWQSITRDQMRRWNVKHHDLLFGKPAADYYVDDKATTIDELYAIVDSIKNSGSR